MSDKITGVVKRDGRVVQFDEGKLEASIHKAMRSVGVDNPTITGDLTGVVALFLEDYYSKRITTEDIQDMVEKVLIETGHVGAARAYLTYRQEQEMFKRRLGLVPDSGYSADGIEVLTTSELEGLSKAYRFDWEVELRQRAEYVDVFISDIDDNTPVAEQADVDNLNAHELAYAALRLYVQRRYPAANLPMCEVYYGVLDVTYTPHSNPLEGGRLVGEGHAKFVAVKQ